MAGYYWYALVQWLWSAVLYQSSTLHEPQACFTLFNFYRAPEFTLILWWCKSGIKPQHTGSPPSGTDLCKQKVCLPLSESPCWLDKLNIFQDILFVFFFLLLTHYSKRLATLTVYTDIHALLSDSLQANGDKCGGQERWLLKNDLGKQKP